MSTEDRIINLVSSDGKMFQIPVLAAKYSVFITEALNLDSDDAEDELDIPRVQGVCLEKVVEYLIYFKDHPYPDMPERLEGKTFETNIKDPWYRKFMEEVEETGENRELLFALKSAANYLDIKPLLEMICLWLTFRMVGKSAEEIRVLLRLPRMTEQEEENAREEHPWMFQEH